MLSKPEISNLNMEPDELDEEWWSAILADEENIYHATDDLSSKNTTPPPSDINWEKVKELQENDGIVELEVYGYNRGGLLARGDGIQGFIPVSHLMELSPAMSDNERFQALSTFVGRVLSLKVIECNPLLERVVFSERAAQAGEGCRRELFRRLKPGKIVTGKVTNITDFGVFIDLGGVEGLVHVSELSWGRVSHPGDILTIGQNVQTMVLQVSEENSRVALSLKRLCKNPWDEISKRYHPGDITQAVITSIVRFGAFARMEEGIEGLIHISSIDLSSVKQNLSSVLVPGQKVQVRIVHIDIERRRLGLGLVNLA